MKSRNEIPLKGRFEATPTATLSQAMPNAGSQFLNKLSQAVSRLFTTPRPRVILIGCDARVRLLATELRAVRKEISLIIPAAGATLLRKAPPGVKVVHSTSLGEVALDRAGAKAAHVVIAGTKDDTLNARLGREARDRFGVPLVIARVKALEGVTPWARLEDAVMVRMTWGDTVRAILGETAPSPRLSHLASVADHEEIVDLEMHSPVLVGRKIADLPRDDYEVLALARNGTVVADFGSAELHLGDVLTLVGTRVELKRIREALTSL
jgi:Trk K+ transport system NAD-binding subunit